MSASAFSSAETVADLLSRERLDADSLVLEITETSVIDEFGRAKQAVEKLRELGGKLSIDDFGGRPTSLAYSTNSESQR